MVTGAPWHITSPPLKKGPLVNQKRLATAMEVIAAPFSIIYIISPYMLEAILRDDDGTHGWTQGYALVFIGLGLITFVLSLWTVLLVEELRHSKFVPLALAMASIMPILFGWLALSSSPERFHGMVHLGVPVLLLLFLTFLVLHSILPWVVKNFFPGLIEKVYRMVMKKEPTK